MSPAAAMTTSAPPCEVLAWDSEHFGCRIGRIVLGGGGCLDRERLAAVDAWCRAEAIDCLYFLADAGDPATAALAEEAGFRLVDLRVTLEGEQRPHPRPLSHLPPAPPPGEGRQEAGSLLFSPLPGTGRGELGEGPGVRAALPDDVPALRRIAAVSHHDSRFYADPHFDRARCDELYATWIEKSCRAQWADPVVAVVLVAGQEGEPLGYISCHVFPPSPGRREGMGEGGQGGEAPAGEIGLLAVSATAQGRGLGGALVDAGLRWLMARGAVRVRVVTQGRNVRAQRLYQAHGLLTRSIGLWFHRWRGSR